MNLASHFARRISTTLSAVTILVAPGRCRAADQPSLPWDHALNVIQTFVAGPLAMFVITVSGMVAILAFVVAGDSEITRRFVKAVVGTGIALIAVELLNYLAI